MWFKFVIAGLAVWRLTHLIALEDGPFDVCVRFRRAVRTKLFTCFFCLSVWIAAPFALYVAEAWLERLVTWWALSGMAVLLQKLASGPALDIEVIDR